MPVPHEDRGGRWLVAQMALLTLAVLAPRWEGRWPARLRLLGRVIGVPVAILGSLLLLAGSWRLGRHLTPFPRPKADSQLVHSGIYGLIRHPIYSGLMGLLLGSALASGRLARIAVAIGSVGFFDAKAHKEEGWLLERFPAYADYRARVSKFVPGVY